MLKFDQKLTSFTMEKISENNTERLLKIAKNSPDCSNGLILITSNGSFQSFIYASFFK